MAIQAEGLRKTTLYCQSEQVSLKVACISRQPSDIGSNSQGLAGSLCWLGDCRPQVAVSTVGVRRTDRI